MAAIEKIVASVTTADVKKAGSDSWVYLGIAGREFLLDTCGDENERNTCTTFVLGRDSNVLRSEDNDPRRPQLDTDDLDRYPVYLRMEPSGRNPDWVLERVVVTVNPDSHCSHRFDNPRLAGLKSDQRITLGGETGKVLFLKRYCD